MAARRLIVILVLLLGASVLAASLAPNRTRPVPPSSSTTTATTEPRAPVPTGESLQARINASTRRPETVVAFVGDQLQLDIGSDPGRTIMIEPLGLAGFAGPDSPAHFNLLLGDPGTVPITDGEGNVVGRLQVSEAKRSPKKPTATKPGSRGGERPGNG